MLENIIRGRTPKPPIVLLYGQEGVGKSTFAAKAPNTIFIPTEDGLNEIDCAKFPVVKNYPEFLATLRAVLEEEHEFETLAVDSISATERMLFRYVCERHGVETIQQANGGYGKGYTEYTNRWSEVLELLSAIREKRNMSIILIGHSDVKTVINPQIGAFDQFQPRLYEKAWKMISEWTDGVFFATRKVRVQKEDAGFNKTAARTVAIGADGGERIMQTTGGENLPFIAKNRFSLPPELPLDWNAFISAWRAAYRNTEEKKGA